MRRYRAPAQLLAFTCALFFLLFIQGCGGSNSSTPGSPSPGQPPPGGSGGGGGGGGGGAPAGRFVYALNGSASQIAGFSFNSSTGALAMLPGSPVSITPSSLSMLATPKTQFLWVSDWFLGTVTTWNADPTTGALTKKSTLNVPHFQTLVLTLDPNGQFIFIADPLGRQIGVLSIAADGSLAMVGAPIATPQPIGELVVDNVARNLYGVADNMIFAYSIGSAGSLTPLPGFPVTVRPPFVNPDKGPTGVNLVVDPAARFLFAADTTAPQTFVYTINADGSLTPVTGSPFSTPGGSGVPAIDPAGRFLFVGGGPIVAAMKINADGSLTPAPGSPYDNGPFRNGGAPVSEMITDPQGKFLLLSDIENSEITVFGIDQNTGALTNVSGSPFMVAAKPIGGGSPSVIVMTQ